MVAISAVAAAIRLIPRAITAGLITVKAGNRLIKELKIMRRELMPKKKVKRSKKSKKRSKSGSTSMRSMGSLSKIPKGCRRLVGLVKAIRKNPRMSAAGKKKALVKIRKKCPMSFRLGKRKSNQKK